LSGYSQEKHLVSFGETSGGQTKQPINTSIGIQKYVQSIANKRIIYRELFDNKDSFD